MRLNDQIYYSPFFTQYYGNGIIYYPNCEKIHKKAFKDYVQQFC